MMNVITHVLAFVVGGSIGVIAMAMLIAGRDE